jgi:hypothetical protein
MGEGKLSPSLFPLVFVSQIRQAQLPLIEGSPIVSRQRQMIVWVRSLGREFSATTRET